MFACHMASKHFKSIFHFFSDVKDKPTIRSAIEKIRFLTLTPQQFAEGPARSSLLTESEAFAVLMNILSSSSDVPMPSGFSTCRVPRKQLIGDGPSSNVRVCIDYGKTYFDLFVFRLPAVTMLAITEKNSPSHLNCSKSSIAKDGKNRKKTRSPDFFYSTTQMKPTGGCQV